MAKCRAPAYATALCRCPHPRPRPRCSGKERWTRSACTGVTPPPTPSAPRTVFGDKALGRFALENALNPYTYNLLPDRPRGVPQLIVLDNVHPDVSMSLLDFVTPRIKKTVPGLLPLRDGRVLNWWVVRHRPCDQSAVQLGKDAPDALMGKPGYADLAKRIQAVAKRD